MGECRARATGEDRGNPLATKTNLAVTDSEDASVDWHESSTLKALLDQSLAQTHLDHLPSCDHAMLSLG
ncbi:MAG TPA: hypothetical protein VFP23_09190 [Solirubrobacterales bacterium]|nr:hypothetical protein [Solirubrobacterales bacterium]